MDWLTIAAAWGPALPMMFIAWRAFRRLVYRTITKEFRMSRKLAIQHEEQASARHAGHMELLACLYTSMNAINCVKKIKPASQKARPGTRKRPRGSKAT